MEKDVSFAFAVRLDENGVMQAHFRRSRLPVEIVITQLRGLLNHLEKPYFEDFSSSISSTEYRD